MIDRNRIIELAVKTGVSFDRAELEAATEFLPKLEAFYRAAYNAGLEAAAKRVEVWDTSFQTGGSFAAAIRALKEEV